MNLSEMLENQPPPLKIPDARAQIRRARQAARSSLVVVDDDPTGTQTVDGVNVYMQWTTDILRDALNEPIFYVSTNSRSLTRHDVEALSHEMGGNLSLAARDADVFPLLASRSDSTLRGHFPYEVNALADGFGMRCDGIIIIPAFFEGGRYTIDDIHYVKQGNEMVSADRTEFARDPVFGFRNANLKLWVEEKTGGDVKADSVHSISLNTIRTGGPEAVEADLMSVSSGRPVAVNAACYEDLEVFVLGLTAAESKGKRFIYRCAASFVKIRGGFEDRPLLTRSEMRPGNGPGLVVVGSYVQRTSRQLEELLKSDLVSGIELRAGEVIDAKTQEAEIGRVALEANERLSAGKSVAVYTSRDRHSIAPEEFLRIGQTIMQSLCEVLRRIEVQPGFLIAKGGITSIEIARSGLGLKQGMVIGQILPGVPVWRLEKDARWSGIPYVVFPGNVGDEHALVRCFGNLVPETGA